MIRCLYKKKSDGYEAVLLWVDYLFKIINLLHYLSPITTTSFQNWHDSTENKHCFDTEVEMWYVTIKRKKNNASIQHSAYDTKFMCYKRTFQAQSIGMGLIMECNYRNNVRSLSFACTHKKNFVDYLLIW